MRMTFHDRPCGTIDGSPSSEQRFERSLHPNADPGDPDAGRPVEDDAASPREQAEGILADAREKLAALGFECELSFSEPLTPTGEFKRASDARWGIGKRTGDKRTGDAADTSLMTPIQRFVAASNKRWGFRS